jgi:hypothetical protein
MARTAASLIFAVLLSLTPPFAATSAERPAADWLRGSGENLEICLRGEILDADGKPVAGAQLTGKMSGSESGHPLKPMVQGHQFEVWIPVNKPDWYALWLRAASADGKLITYKELDEFQLRQAAIDGLKLTLQPRSRHVRVKVVESGKPVADATVKASLGFGIELRATTDINGVAQLSLLPNQEISQLTAWTADHRVGGFSFDRKPPRDPEADEQTIELSKCRDQRIRLQTKDGSPAPGVKFVLHIATPPPDYNFMGEFEHCILTTDSAGEAVCGWFPDWKDAYLNVTTSDAGWLVDDEFKLIDGVAVFTAIKRRPRVLAAGRVTSTGTSTCPGSFYVMVRSFQGERENYSDMTSVFTDSNGTFTIDVLPDATYCAYAEDERWVGKTIDVLPFESAVNRISPIELEVVDGQPVEVLLTSGPNKEPLANQRVSFRREHEYSWLEDGERRSGIGGRSGGEPPTALGKPLPAHCPASSPPPFTRRAGEPNNRSKLPLVN